MPNRRHPRIAELVATASVRKVRRGFLKGVIVAASHDRPVVHEQFVKRLLFFRRRGFPLNLAPTYDPSPLTTNGLNERRGVQHGSSAEGRREDTKDIPRSGSNDEMQGSAPPFAQGQPTGRHAIRFAPPNPAPVANSYAISFTSLREWMYSVHRSQSRSVLAFTWRAARTPSPRNSSCVRGDPLHAVHVVPTSVGR